jgi:hypothetical protein
MGDNARAMDEGRFIRRQQGLKRIENVAKIPGHVFPSRRRPVFPVPVFVWRLFARAYGLSVNHGGGLSFSGSRQVAYRPSLPRGR